MLAESCSKIIYDLESPLKGASATKQWQRLRTTSNHFWNAFPGSSWETFACAAALRGDFGDGLGPGPTAMNVELAEAGRCPWLYVILPFLFIWMFCFPAEHVATFKTPNGVSLKLSMSPERGPRSQSQDLAHSISTMSITQPI